MIIMVAVRACVCVWRLKRIFHRYHHQFSTLLPDFGPLMKISAIGREILTGRMTRPICEAGRPPVVVNPPPVIPVFLSTCTQPVYVWARITGAKNRYWYDMPTLRVRLCSPPRGGWRAHVMRRSIVLVSVSVCMLLPSREGRGRPI